MNEKLSINLDMAIRFHDMMEREGDMLISDFEDWLTIMGLYETLSIKEPGWIIDQDE